MSRNTVARIDIDALRHNLSVVRQRVGDSRVVCVVKADAYGHGIARVARALEGADLLAVATASELRAVRQAGWTGRLLLLEGFNGVEEYQVVRELDAEFVVHHASQLDLLDQQGLDTGRQVWLKIDTGMHRLGFAPEDFTAVHAKLRRWSDTPDPVLMSHFACADDPANDMTRRQLAQFDALAADIPGEQSLANSAAVINFPQSLRDYVRPGIMLYGVSPVPGQTGAQHGLKPVMTLECRLLAINHCQAGDPLGYGARYRCPEDMRVGVAGIGYGDGYPRALPDGAPVLVNGRPARLAGAVSMDLVTIDLRGHDDAMVGDTVTLWGNGLPIERLAECADTIPYTLSCGVTGRVRRTAGRRDSG